ncbi:hypothetical protein CspHIS471_0201060 [Cutaneotrichosporon sp. HIS471]|nr:hypothetical protein CspHIS471_0201060 [Cutaneotrichosporon sp. HIS471]
MLLPLFTAAALALTTSAAILNPLSPALLARDDKVTCRAFLHNTDKSTWNLTGALPQVMTEWLDCPNGTFCALDILDRRRFGWKYYWDVPEGVTLDLGRYNPAKAIGAGFNEVIRSTPDRSIKVPEGKTTALIAVITSIVHVPGIFKKCDNGMEYAGAITLPDNKLPQYTKVSLDETGNWDKLEFYAWEEGRYYFLSVSPAQGNERSIMSADEMKTRKDTSGSSRSASLDSRLAAVTLAITFLSLAIL